MKASLPAATSCIIAGVTAGFIRLPAEASLLGARFAFFSNIFQFLLSIGVAPASVAALRLTP